MAGNAEEIVLRLALQVSGAATMNAAQSQLESAIKREQQALAGLDEKLIAATKNLKALQQGFGGSADIAAVRKQQDLIRSINEQSARGQGALGGLLGARGLAAQADAQKAAERTAAAQKKSEGEATKVAAAQVQVAQAAAQVAAKVLSLLAAIVATAARLVYFTVQLADAARSARLLNEAAAGGVIAGAELTAVIADVANRVPLARDKIAEMARALEYARFQGREMQLVLQTMATVASTVGDSAAGKIQQIAESSRQARRFLLGARDVYGEFADLAGTGLKSADIYAALAANMKVSIAQAKALLLAGRVSVRQGIEALNTAAETRFGKTVAAQMLALSTQLAKFKENISSIFAGLDLEPLLRGLRAVTDLFSQTTVTGRALKLIAETALQPLINAITTAAPIARAFTQGLIIGTLLVVLAVLKLRRVLLDAFGGETRSSIDWVQTAMYAGIGAVGALTAVVLVLVAALTFLAVGALMVAAPFFIAAFAIYKIISGISTLAQKIGETDLGDAAQNMVDSFINGIRARLGAVGSAMAAMGAAAKNGLYGALRIQSPSKVALEAAHNVTSTFAGGVVEGSGETRAAFSTMVDPKAIRGGSAAGGDTIYLTVHYGGPREEQDGFIEKLRRALEQVKGEGPIPQGSG